MRLRSKVSSCGSSSTKLINYSLKSLSHDDSCKRLADLLSTILDCFDILLIENMPERHPWRRLFLDKYASLDAATRGLKEDIPESLLISRSYVLLIYLRIFVRRLHLCLIPASPATTWPSICSELKQYLRIHPAQSVQLCLYVLLRHLPYYHPEKIARPLNEELNTVTLCIETLPYSLTGATIPDPPPILGPLHMLDRLDTQFPGTRPSEQRESSSMIFYLVSPYYIPTGHPCWGRVLPIDPRLLESALYGKIG